MKNLLYIGNYLRSNNTNVSSIHTLGSLLESEGYGMYFSSDKNNKIYRMLDMIMSVLQHRSKIDMVIIDTYSTLNFYFALIISQLCRLLKLSYITNLNGGNLPMRLRTNPFLCGLIFNNAYRNVAPSEYLKEAFEDYGYSKLRFIPNTITVKNYPLSKKTFDEPKLLWVRSFSKIYNPKLAIKVFQKLNDKGYNPSLCMVGPDSDGTMKEIKELVNKLNLKVKFTGKLSKTEWIELSKGYNIFINTTDFDNTPVSVIEAMALGLPIVSTNVGGMSYLIDDEIHGLLVEPRNADLMIDAIIRIIKDDDLRNKVIYNSRLRAEQFDWEEIKHDWQRILSK